MLLCPTLWSPIDYSCQAPLSMGFPRQEYWNGLSFSSPGDLPKPGSKFPSLAIPASAGSFFTTESPKKPPFTGLPYNIIRESHEAV